MIGCAFRGVLGKSARAENCQAEPNGHGGRRKAGPPAKARLGVEQEFRFPISSPLFRAIAAMNSGNLGRNLSPLRRQWRSAIDIVIVRPDSNLQPDRYERLPASLMYFCSGEPMHFLSGVDSSISFTPESLLRLGVRQNYKGMGMTEQHERLAKERAEIKTRVIVNRPASSAALATRSAVQRCRPGSAGSPTQTGLFGFRLSEYLPF